MTDKRKAEEFRLVLGRRIKEFRKAAGLTQEQLSEIVDIAPQYLSRLETGRRAPSLDTIIELAEALNTTPSALLAEVRQDVQAERVGRLAALFSSLAESDAAFLESELAGWMSHLRSVRGEL